MVLKSRISVLSWSANVYAGLCVKWLNRAFDKCIELNFWPVRFEDENNRYDFNTLFIVSAWVIYVWQMYGQPEITSNVLLKVLEYLYSQPAKVVKAWRNRIYRFTSGTYFKATAIALEAWVRAADFASDDEGQLEDDHLDDIASTRLLSLRKLRNVDGLFTLLSDTIFMFIQLKNTPFPLVFRSKKDFLAVESWKRAMIFVNLFRFVTKRPANKQ